MAIDGPETTAGAPPKGAGQPRQVILVTARNGGASRQGMKVQRRCCAKAVEAQPAILRPDQAIEEAIWSGRDTGVNGDGGAPEAPQDDQNVNHWPSHLILRPCASFHPAYAPLTLPLPGSETRLCVVPLPVLRF